MYDRLKKEKHAVKKCTKLGELNVAMLLTVSVALFIRPAVLDTIA